MAAYVPVADGTKVGPGITEDHSMIQILAWIGFTVEANCTAIINHSLSSWEDYCILREKDIKNTALEWASRIVAKGRLHFGVCRTKRLQSLVHWVQDFYRISETPSIEGLEKATFLTALSTAMSRADVRAMMLEQSGISAKAVSSGPLNPNESGRIGGLSLKITYQH